MNYPKTMNHVELVDMSTRLLHLGYKVPVISVQLWSGNEQHYMREWIERAERAKFQGKPAPHIGPYLLRYYQIVNQGAMAK